MVAVAVGETELRFCVALGDDKNVLRGRRSTYDTELDLGALGFA